MYAGRGGRVKPKPLHLVVCNAARSLHLVEMPGFGVHAKPTLDPPRSTHMGVSSTAWPGLLDEGREVVDDSVHSGASRRRMIVHLFDIVRAADSPFSDACPRSVRRNAAELWYRAPWRHI